MKKKYPTAIDETALLFDRIYVSAGARGETVALSPQFLIDFVSAETADLIVV